MTYSASGKLSLFGCAKCSYVSNVLTLFETGDVVYIKKSAIQKGILESVFIKRVNIIDQNRWNYQDKENRIWIERELCTLDDANSLISEYTVHYQQQYLILVSECSPKLEKAIN